MQYNNINGCNISQLGLGFMRQSGSLAQAKELVQYAINNGVNYFEACTFYLDDACEQIVGQALKDYPRDKYYICDKISVLGTPKDTFEPDNLERFFENQLQKCGVAYFDVYLLQALDRQALPIVKKYNLIQFLQKKKQEGKIKNIGFSFHDTNEILLQYLELFTPDCVQIQLNYYDWYLGVAKDLYFTLRERDIPIIVMGPLKGGTITNKLPAKIQSDFRKSFPNLQLVDLSFDFLRALPGVKVVLTGAERMDFLQQNVEYFNKPFKGFTAQEKQLIQIILKEYQKYSLIKCTNCKYCISVCPLRIKTPELFECYNQIMSGNDPDGEYRKQYYNIIKNPGTFFDCMHCGACECKCPQHLNIRQIFDTTLFAFRL